MSCPWAPVVLFISDLLGSFSFLKSLFGTSLGDHVDRLFFFFFFFSHKAYGILVPRPGTEVVPPALEAQSLNHWTTGEVPCGQFLFVFIAALPTSFTRGVALSGVPSGAGWLHSATKEFPDCLPAFFLFLGICFFFLWPVEELVFVFRVLWFSQGKPRYGFFPFCFMAVGSVDACVDPSWKTAAVTAYIVCVLAPRRPVISWACVRSLLPSL